MKYKVYDEAEEKKEPEAEVILKLGVDPYNKKQMHVYAVDEKGQRIDRGVLIVFRSDGTVRIPIHVNEKLGFKLGERGRIEITNSSY